MAEIVLLRIKALWKESLRRKWLEWIFSKGKPSDDGLLCAYFCTTNPLIIFWTMGTAWLRNRRSVGGRAVAVIVHLWICALSYVLRKRVEFKGTNPILFPMKGLGAPFPGLVLVLLFDCLISRFLCFKLQSRTSEVELTSFGFTEVPLRYESNNHRQSLFTD